MIQAPKDPDRVLKIAIKDWGYGIDARDNNAIPYLERLQASNELFDSRLKFEGLVRNPSTGDYHTVISQPKVDVEVVKTREYGNR